MSKKVYGGMGLRRRTIPTIPPDPSMVKSQQGGYVFKVDDFQFLDKFLLIGVDGDTYYTTEKDLGRQCYDLVAACVIKDGMEVVQRCQDYAERALRMSPLLYALSVATTSDDKDVRRAAFDVAVAISRTPNDFFEFIGYVLNQRGWGRAAKRAVHDWFTRKPADSLAFEIGKYRNRSGWTQRDMLRVGHVKPLSGDYNLVYKWAVGKASPEDLKGDGEVRRILRAYDAMRDAKDTATVVRLIEQDRMPRESVPTDLLNHADVWRALAKQMPDWGILRNLNKFSSLGLTDDTVEDTISPYLIGRIDKLSAHPFMVYIAMLVYAHGKGVRGSLEWTPNDGITAALERNFIAGLSNVDKINGKVVFGIDVSGSMAGENVAGIDFIRAWQAASALAYVGARICDDPVFIAYNTKATFPTITPAMSIAEVEKALQPGGGTDCAQPILAAPDGVDAFVILTDSQQGDNGVLHVPQAIADYRRRAGKQVKLIVVAMATNEFSIADMSSKNAHENLIVCGMDGNLMSTIAAFVNW